MICMPSPRLADVTSALLGVSREKGKGRRKSACGPSERPEGSAAERRPRARARGGGAPRAVSKARSKGHNHSMPPRISVFPKFAFDRLVAREMSFEQWIRDAATLGSEGIEHYDRFFP